MLACATHQVAGDGEERHDPHEEPQHGRSHELVLGGYVAIDEHLALDRTLVAPIGAVDFAVEFLCVSRCK